jgi:hypothetical protein
MPKKQTFYIDNLFTWEAKVLFSQPNKGKLYNCTGTRHYRMVPENEGGKLVVPYE